MTSNVFVIVDSGRIETVVSIGGSVRSLCNGQWLGEVETYAGANCEETVPMLPRGAETDFHARDSRQPCFQLVV